MLDFDHIIACTKKRLKISKEYLETVNQRTDYTTNKRKKTCNSTEEIEIEEHKPQKKTDVNYGALNGQQFLLHQ